MRGRGGRDPIETLAGTSLEVYLYLLEKGGPAGVREVQRALGFRSPSTARHHLERLVELGLARRTSEGYLALPPRGLLSNYIVVRGRLLPRALFTAGFSVAVAAAYAIIPGGDPVASVLLGVVAALTAWEAWELYRSAPRRKRRGPTATS